MLLQPLTNWQRIPMKSLKSNTKIPLFTFPGQRDITPTFGYNAPHLSIRGTLTLPTYALPSTHYGLVRLRLKKLNKSILETHNTLAISRGLTG
jgi:hypothetical protein